MNKIALQLIEKALELSEECQLNKQYFRGVWHFYRAYNLSLKFLGKTDSSLDKKNKYWKRVNELGGGTDSKDFKKLKDCMEKDIKIISEARNKLKLEAEDIDELGDIYRPKTIGVFSYDFPDEYA